MKRRRWFSLLTLLLIGTMILSACNFSSSNGETEGEGDTGNGNGEETPEVAQILKMDASADIPTLDSTKAHDGVAFTVLNNVNEGLYRQDQNNQPILAIAETHDESDDGLVHTFTLRDAKWSNGDPVTAQDFEFAWKRVMAEAGPYNFMFVTASVKNAEKIINGEATADELGVVAKDEKTLEVTLEAPNPLFKTLLTFPTFLPQNQAFVEELGDQYALEAENILANGPFKLVEWTQEQGWKYEKNPDYWDAANVKLDEIHVTVVKDSMTSANLFEEGTIDRTTLSAELVDQYTSHEDFSISKQSGIGFLRFNHNHPALSNVNIRRAIDMAIDKQGLTDVILKNGAQPLYGVVPAGFYFSPDQKDYRELNGDFNKGTVEEAQELWQQGLEEIGQDSVAVSINTSDAESSKKMAEYLQAQLQEKLPGFTLEIKAVPFAQRLEIEKAVEYDLSLSTWGPDYSDPMTYLDMWVEGASTNRMDYVNKDLNALVDQARTETDPSARYQMLLDIEKILLEEDAAIAPLYQSGLALLQRSKIKGLVEHPTGAEFTFKWAYIEE
ncbi:oligopeptide transport system substrate-binding protein [Bacillus oleivorans]|uniref:Oligopeptide transport system substrate-binding protein n=1 Tax=Bacillus oleivorans TaxID=1448271 RepID=A0A285CIT5_9BACI|nr:peptide ABC transporter substrate-binding protein [Bacillus oleivorans]SNX67265.1 oligopeptide transport system substrate-binding protein [Bacillus oleivorans]